MISKFERAGFIPLEQKYNDLDLYRRDQVGLITLHKYKSDRKASRESANHMDPPMIDELLRALDLFERDESIQSLLIASAQPAAFSRGAKIELLLEADEQECRSFIDVAQSLILKMHGFSMPIIALIDGFALGGGMELILGCDYRLSSNRETLAYGLPEASLGIIPAMGGTLNLRRLTSGPAAREILLGARVDITAAEAAGLGLVDKVVPPGELLDEGFALGQKPDLPRTSRISDTEPSVTGEEIRRGIEDYLRGKEIKTSPGEKSAPLSKALLHFLISKSSVVKFREGLLYEKEVFCYLQGTEDSREGILAMTEERNPRFRGI